MPRLPIAVPNLSEEHTMPRKMPAPVSRKAPPETKVRSEVQHGEKTQGVAAQSVYLLPPSPRGVTPIAPANGASSVRGG